MSKYAGLEGTKFYRLTLLEGFVRNQLYYYKCLCDCGSIVNVRADALNEIGSRGATKSCGCYRTELIVARSTKHGNNRKGKSTPEYNSWCSMKGRCENANNQRYSDYGGRGITICERWQSFENFLEDMGERPTPKHSIDRIDNNKGYSKDNCKWSDYTEQNCNQRTYKTNTSGTTGVDFDKASGKWRAAIRVNKKGKTLGRFSTLEEAKQARLDAELKYFGRIIQR